MDQHYLDAKARCRLRQAMRSEIGCGEMHGRGAARGDRRAGLPLPLDTGEIARP
jgi:hypothetical protein